MAPFCGNIADFVEARLQLLWQPRPKGNLREVLRPRLHVTGWSDFVARVQWLPFLSLSSCFPGDLSFSFSVEGRAGSLGPQAPGPWVRSSKTGLARVSCPGLRSLLRVRTRVPAFGTCSSSRSPFAGARPATAKQLQSGEPLCGLRTSRAPAAFFVSLHCGGSCA